MIRSLSLFAVVALASVPALATPRPVKSDLDIAKANPSSLFNRPEAHIQTSDTGGHIATIVDKKSFSDSTGYGDKATVEVEVTDPFGYYKGGEKTAPEAIRANVASYKVWSGHNLGRAEPQGTDVTLTRIADGVYHGKVQVQASTRQGDDMGINLGEVSVSFAGKNGSWDSRYGRNYVAPVTVQK